MIKSQYDAIISGVSGSNFTGYYKKGLNFKLSDSKTVITVWKPGCCSYNQEEVYKDAVIEISGNSTNVFVYQDMMKIGEIIEFAIDYLNAEKENFIDREKISTYEHIVAPVKKTQSTKAIKYADLEIGGIYLDEKKNKWIFLGKGTLFLDGVQFNRTNDGQNYSEYLYMEAPDADLEEVAINEFRGKSYPKPESYSSKKRFFEKVGNLRVTQGMPIIFHCGCEKIQTCHGLKPKSRWELTEERGRKI